MAGQFIDAPGPQQQTGQFIDAPGPSNNPQSSDVGAARLGTPYGQSQKQQEQQPSWIVNKLKGGLNLANIAMGGGVHAFNTPEGQALAAGAASPGIWATQLAGKAGVPGAANLASNLQDYTSQVLSGTPAAQGRPTSQGNIQPGMAGEAYSLGQMLPQSALFEASKAGNLANMTTSKMAPGILKNIATGSLGAGLFGAGASAISPVQNPDNYVGEYATNIIKNAGMGAALGGVLSGAVSLPDALNKNVPTPSSVSDILKANRVSSVPQAELMATGNDPLALKAQEALKQIRISTATDNGINLSLGDITNDPMTRLTEKGIQGSLGSGGNKMRVNQGTQFQNAITKAEEAVVANLDHVLHCAFPFSNALTFTSG